MDSRRDAMGVLRKIVGKKPAKKGILGRWIAYLLVFALAVTLPAGPIYADSPADDGQESTNAFLIKAIKKGKVKILKIKLSPAKATNLKIRFKSSKKGIATVDASGKIRALKKGKTVITVKAGGKTVKVKLTVK